jgi:hypothetical protein
MQVSLNFKTKRDYNRFMRNYHAGKGTNISKKNCDLEVEGYGFFDAVKSIGKDIGKKVVKDVATAGIKAGSEMAKGAIRSRVGPLGGVTDALIDAGARAGQQQVNKKISGMGLFDGMQKIGMRAVNSKVGKDLIKMGIQEGAKQAKKGLAYKTWDRSGIGNAVINATENALVNKVGGALQYSDSLGGNGLAESVSNINSKMARVRSFRGGSFRLPN